MNGNGSMSPLAAFEMGLTFEAYLPEMETLARHMREQYEATTLSTEVVAEFAPLIELHSTVQVLVITEDYCPDSVLNLPILVRLSEAIPALTVRIVRRAAVPELAERYVTTDGFNHIPTFVFLDEAGRDLGVWFERPAAAHKFLAEYIRAHPQPSRTLDDGSINLAYRDWAKSRLAAQKVAYRDRLWQETGRELQALLENVSSWVS